jgi:hypothetical protein
MEKIFDSIPMQLISLASGIITVTLAINGIIIFFRRRSLLGRRKYLDKLTEYHDSHSSFFVFIVHEAAAIFLLIILAVVCILIGNTPLPNTETLLSMKQNPNSLTALLYRGEILFFILSFVAASAIGLSKVATLLTLTSHLMNFEKFKQQQEEAIEKLKNKLMKKEVI